MQTEIQTLSTISSKIPIFMILMLWSWFVSLQKKTCVFDRRNIFWFSVFQGSVFICILLHKDIYSRSKNSEIHSEKSLKIIIDTEITSEKSLKNYHFISKTSVAGNKGIAAHCQSNIFLAIRNDMQREADCLKIPECVEFACNRLIDV